MQSNESLKPEVLERYSFWWSEARLFVAALALLLGGIPPVYLVTPPSFVLLVSLLLKVAWLISGAASLYLLYEWYRRGQRVFGGKDTIDLGAFFVMIVSGLNLGLVSLLGRNIGMALTPTSLTRPIFVLVALLYIVSAVYLWTRWQKSGDRVFSN